MNHKDFVYKSAFDYCYGEGLTEKQAGDLASEAIRLWRRDSSFGKAMQEIKKRAKPLIRQRKKQLSARAGS